MRFNRFVAHVIALFCYPFVALIVGLLHKWIFSEVLNTSHQSVFSEYTVITFPMFSIPLFVFWLGAWEIMRALLKRRLGLIVTLMMAVVVPLVFGFVVTGNGGYSLSGPHQAYTYAFLVINLVVAVIHFVVVGKSENQQS